MNDGKGRLFFFYHAYVLPTFIYTGREMMLDEITFEENGWPVINGGRGPSASALSPFGAEQRREELAFFDDFTESKLRPDWQWPVGTFPNVRIDVSAGGQLVLAPGEKSGPLGAVLARSCTNGDYVATTVVDSAALSAGGSASLSAFGDSANAVGLAIADDRPLLWRVQKGQRQELARGDALRPGAIHLRLTVSDGHRLQFAIGLDGKEWTSIGDSADGDYLPPWDRNIRVALIANRTEARISEFRIEPLPN